MGADDNIMSERKRLAADFLKALLGLAERRGAHGGIHIWCNLPCNSLQDCEGNKIAALA